MEISQVVYVVDDDRDVSRAVARLLESVGLACRTFDSAESALNGLPADASGCLVMDVRMPVMSGVQAYVAMKTLGIDLPVVFVTAHSDVVTTVRAMRAGAIDVLLKPFNNQTLIDAVHEALAEDRRRRTSSQGLVELRRREAQLTSREREVMEGVVAGRPNKVIAADLGTTEKTVKVHRAHVMRKMGAGSLPELVRIADRLRNPS